MDKNAERAAQVWANMPGLDLSTADEPVALIKQALDEVYGDGFKAGMNFSHKETVARSIAEGLEMAAGMVDVHFGKGINEMRDSLARSIRAKARGF